MMPLFIILGVLTPFMAVGDAFKIMSTGYTINSAYVELLISITLIFYISTRFKNLRRIYTAFPSLYEIMKYFVFACIFIGFGTEILNWFYIKVDSTRHLIGIICFVLFIVLWRIFIFIYYKKVPIINLAKKQDDMRKFDNKAQV